MREVLSSASEAELCSLFLAGKAACPIRATLEELGHPQPPTVLVTDNTTAAGIANDSLKQKLSKAIDMRFYWIRDRVRQDQFYVHWRRGVTNRADYSTKHHPAAHHRAIRSTYLYSPDDPSQNYFDCRAADGNDGHSSSSSPLGSLDPGEGVLGVLESQDPEAQQPSSPTGFSAAGKSSIHLFLGHPQGAVFVLTSLTQDAEDGLSREGANILYVDPATGVVRKRWVTPPNADNGSGSGEDELVGFYGSSGYEYLIVKVGDLFNGTSSGRYITYDTGTESERWTFLILPPERGGPAFDNSIPAIIQTVRLCTLDNREETYPRLML
jgi:hypothetical protein